jgi:SSS family solute:Na+ symporter
MKVGGFGQAVASSDDPLLFAHVGNAGWAQQLGWYVMGFAITCSYQTMIQRGLAARSSEVARKGFVYGGLIALIWYMVPYVTGLLGAILYGPEVDADEVMLKMSDELLNPYWGALIVVTILAASMSTLDSTVNTIASNLTIDVYRRFINRRASARRLLFVSRLNVVLAALLAAAIYYFVPLMMELFWIGGRVMGAALTPVLVGFLLVPSVRRAPRAVMVTLIVGGVGTILSQLLIGSQRVEGSGALTWSIDPILLGLPISTAVLAAGTWMEVRGNDSISP